jgi:hypothetical protein
VRRHLLALLLLLTPLVVAPGQEVIKGAIEGQVIDAVNGTPVPGVTVGLFGRHQPPPATTDEKGRFRFADLEPRPHGVAVWAGSGYVARKRIVTVNPGPEATRIDVKVYKSPVVAGRVRDRRGRPVPGAMVAAVRGAGSFGRFAKTNDKGEYRISSRDPGTFRLKALRAPLRIRSKTLRDDDDPAERKPVVADVETYYPDSASWETAAAFTVGLGQVLEGMDITIARQETVCVESKAIDLEGKNESPLNIRVESDRQTMPIAQGVELPAGTGFEVCGLAQGSYRLVAGLTHESGRYAVARFSVTERGVRLPDMHLERPVTVPGRLAIDSEGDRRPLPSPVFVGLRRPNGTIVTGEELGAQVHEEGDFAIKAALRDEYRLMIRAPAGFYVKSATMAGRDALRQTLYAGGGELIVVLGQDGARLSVSVVDEEKRAVSDAVVILGRDPLPPEPTADELTARPTLENGRAVFEGVAPGEYRVMAFGELWDDSAPINPDFFLAHRTDGERIKVGPGESRTVEIKAR